LRLDTLARVPLWRAGLDYQHGTGHGVGSHLNVHEGPQSIGPRCTGAALEVGNVLSNEPGYYEPGAFGIRIENLVLVVEDEKLSRNGDVWHRFENLTLCPIDTRLIDERMLSEEQRSYLNRYHARVRRELSPLLDTAHRKWLRRACQPI
jgi:Xaa-Pro aminopeptidase